MRAEEPARDASYSVRRVERSERREEMVVSEVRWDASRSWRAAERAEMRASRLATRSCASPRVSERAKSGDEHRATHLQLLLVRPLHVPLPSQPGHLHLELGDPDLPRALLPLKQLDLPLLLPPPVDELAPQLGLELLAPAALRALDGERAFEGADAVGLLAGRRRGGGRRDGGELGGEALSLSLPPLGIRAALCALLIQCAQLLLGSRESR